MQCREKLLVGVDAMSGKYLEGTNESHQVPRHWKQLVHVVVFVWYDVCAEHNKGVEHSKARFGTSRGHWPHPPQHPCPAGSRFVD